MTTAERYEQVRRIFHEVCELDAAARALLLDSRCGGDTQLRAEVEQLLASEPAPDDSFLESGPPLPPPLVPEPAQLVGRRLGRYRVERVVATGGMGTVFEAEQERPQRRVALKLMRGDLLSDSARRRFEFESELLARVGHPGIAQVYEAGSVALDDAAAARTVPFIAMELVEGARTLVDHAQRARLDVRARIELFAAVCDAVHHAHQKGVIHRDLKPGNLLVDARGAPKVIDFGIGRPVGGGATLGTSAGELLGTLAYMSPEQCGGDPADVDVRSDVYSLGVVLFELLCGRLPHDVRDLPLARALDVVRDAAPPRPSLVRPGLDPDLDAIVLTALAKERDRRYASVAELAADLRRHLRREPVGARPPSAVYHVRRFVQRHRLLTAAAAALVLSMAAGITATSNAADRARRAQAAAEDETATVTAINDFLLGDLLGAVDPRIARGRDVAVREIVARAAAGVGERFAGRPRVEASVRATLGRLYTALGEFEEAEPQLAAALELRRRHLGERDRATIDALHETALLNWHLGRHQLAEQQQLAVLAEREALLGPAHADTLAAENALAIVLATVGRFDDAAARFDAVLARADAARDAELIAVAKGGLANVRWEQGRLEEAAKLAREQVDALIVLGGAESPAAISACNDLATVLASVGRFEEAEPWIEQAHAHAAEVLGTDHPVTLKIEANRAFAQLERRQFADAAKVLEELVAHADPEENADALIVWRSNLGAALIGLGRFADAHPHLERAVADCRATQPGHWLEGAHLSRLGEALAGLGRDLDAEKALREAYAIDVERLGAGDGRTARTVRALIRFLEARDRAEEALELWRALRDALAARRGEDDFHTLDATNEMGAVLHRLRRHADAEALFRAALPRAKSSLAPDHSLTRLMTTNLATQCTRQGRPEEALPLLREALAACERALGPRNAETALLRGYLAQALFDAGDAEEALAEFEESIAISRELGPVGLRRLGSSLWKYGDALTALDRLDEAQAALEESHAIFAKGRGPTHPETREIAASLAALLRKRGNEDAARKIEEGAGQ